MRERCARAEVDLRRAIRRNGCVCSGLALVTGAPRIGTRGQLVQQRAAPARGAGLRKSGPAFFAAPFGELGTVENTSKFL